MPAAQSNAFSFDFPPEEEKKVPASNNNLSVGGLGDGFGMMPKLSPATSPKLAPQVTTGATPNPDFDNVLNGTSLLQAKPNISPRHSSSGLAPPPMAPPMTMSTNNDNPALASKIREMDAKYEQL